VITAEISVDVRSVSGDESLQGNQGCERPTEEVAGGVWDSVRYYKSGRVTRGVGVGVVVVVVVGCWLLFVVTNSNM
jgi:hypothetical protein